MRSGNVWADSAFVFGCSGGPCCGLCAIDVATDAVLVVGSGVRCRRAADSCHTCTCSVVAVGANGRGCGLICRHACRFYLGLPILSCETRPRAAVRADRVYRVLGPLRATCAPISSHHGRQFDAKPFHKHRRRGPSDQLLSLSQSHAHPILSLSPTSTPIPSFTAAPKANSTQTHTALS